MPRACPWVSTFRVEFDRGDEDRTPGSAGKSVHFNGYYGELFYEIAKPAFIPKWFPMVSLTPYYRYDTRNFVTTPITGTETIIDVNRHTFALRYKISSDDILKAEYQLNGQSAGDSVHDNLFLMSFVRPF